MKTIGIIGGLTWHSTVEYYKLFNSLVNEKLGGVHSAKVILHSLDFAEIKPLTEKAEWNNITSMMTDHAKKLEIAGADCILLGANTMHNIADEVQAAVQIPLIHIADATSDAIIAKGLKKVALLGTKYTMQMDFFVKRLAAKGIEAIIPDEESIRYINTAIYNEMSVGKFLPETNEKFISIINELAVRGAEGVIGGCTEIPILVKQHDINIPLFDTGYLHAKAAVDFALQ